MNSNRLVLVSLTMALAIMLLPVQAPAVSPKETVEVQVNKVLQALAAPAFKDQPRDAKIAKTARS